MHSPDLIMGVGLCLRNLSPEETVCYYKIEASQDHTDAPPDQANQQAIGMSRCVGNGQIVGRIDGGKNHGIETQSGAA